MATPARAFSDDDLKRLKEAVKAHQDVCRCTCKTGQVETIEALLARLKGSEGLLDRALERLKLINGPESKCVYADNDVLQCENHRLIREIEEWRLAAKK